MTTIRILSYNVLFGKRIDRIIDWANRLPDYDVLCFQEFPKPKIKECMELLSRRPYGYRYVPSFTFRKKLYGQLTMYRTDRLTLRTTKVVNLGTSAPERILMKTRIPRTCLITEFRYGKEAFTVANVHLVALAWNKLKYLQVGSVIASLAKRNGPAVLVGDFNISSIAGKKKLLRLMESSGYTYNKKRIATHRVAIFKHQFDYVFARGATIRTVTPYRVPFSDHYPLDVKLLLP